MWTVSKRSGIVCLTLMFVLHSATAVIAEDNERAEAKSRLQTVFSLAKVHDQYDTQVYT